MMLSQSSETVNLYFVIPKNGVDSCEDEMKMAFQDCIEANLNPKWVSESLAYNFKDKKDVIVLDKFKGEVFETIKKHKCVRICGPRCIRVCLAENSPIPETNSPIYMTAMRGLVVTATGIGGSLKGDVKNNVSYMGGVYSNNLVESVTHLVCGNVQTAKYAKAAEFSIPLLTMDWVNAIWREGLKRNVHANDPEFIEKYKCPIFYNLNITSTNLTTQEKQEVTAIINKHGGVYSGQMKQNSTNVLIVSNDGKSSAKYEHARSWGISCVKISWIYDSLKKGYAVNADEHTIAPTVRCSTPTGSKDELPSFAGSDISMVSSIGIQGKSDRSGIDESIMSNATAVYKPFAQETKKKLQTSGPSQSYKKVLENLQLAEAKKAGPFLDGCKIYLSGFTSQEQDKLRRVLNVGGAVIFTELTESVSHMITGDFVASDGRLLNKLMNRPHVLGVEWLVASLKQGSPALESLFSKLEPACSQKMSAEPPSPLSQKGAQLLMKKDDFKTPQNINSTEKEKQADLKLPSSDKSGSNSSSGIPVNRNLFQDFVNNHNFNKSTSKTGSDIPKTKDDDGSLDNESNLTDLTTEESEIFKDLVFMILGFEIDAASQIEEAIKINGGKVVSQTFSGMTDYTVVPLNGAPVTGIQSEVITSYWLDDCCESKSIVGVQYFHQPISISGNRTPLSGCVITLSTYSMREREFLRELVIALGALCQETLARKTNINKGIHGNTHLVIPTGGSQKYKAAINWKIHVVTKDWLMACAVHGTKVPEHLYQVPNSEETQENSLKAPSNDIGKNDKVEKMAVETPNSKPPRDENLIKNSNKKTRQNVETPKQSSMSVEHFPLKTPQIDFTSQKFTEIPKNQITPKQNLDSDMPMKISTPKSSFIPRFTSTSKETTPIFNVNPDDMNKSKNSLNLQEDNSNHFIRMPVDDLRSGSATKIRRLSAYHTPSRNNQNLSTPETPYEEIFDEHGKSARKKVKRWIDRMDAEKQKNPLLIPNISKRRNSTPLKVLLKRGFDKFGNTPETSFNEEEKVPTPGSETSGLEQSRCTSSSLDEKVEKLNKELSTPNSTPVVSAIPRRISISNIDREQSDSGSSSPIESNIRLNPTFESQSGHGVGWDEPIESAEKAKQVNKNSEIELGMNDLDPKDRKFVITNCKDSVKTECIRMIESLGAEYLSEDRYCFETTHILTESPVRSEKLLCSIAAGRWVLHVSYIEQCYKANKFLLEEDFEWGNPRSKENIPPLNNERDQNLGNAVYRWRSKLQNTDSGVYEGMRVVLALSNRKLSENLTRLITAGKGIILNKSQILEATHCFVDEASYGEIDFRTLAAKNIYCLPPIYLGNFITEDPTPDPNEWVIKEYKKYVKQKS